MEKEKVDITIKLALMDLAIKLELADRGMWESEYDSMIKKIKEGGN